MVDPVNRGPELRAVVSTFVSLAFTATALRVYVRVRLVKAFGWDDGFMLLALLSQIFFATCAIGGIEYGTGRHMVDLTGQEIHNAMRYWWLCYIGYCWAMISSKTSIGLFLLRVAVKPVHKWILYLAMGITVFTGFVFFFVTLFQCSPISFFWNRHWSTDGSCIPIDVIIALTFLYSACAIISDFTFAILPIFLVWGLNMPAKTRILLIPVLGMACIASIAVVVRLAYVMDFKNPDFLYATVDVAIWSEIEQGLAITAGSLATLRPLYRKLASQLGFSADGSSGPSIKTPAQVWTPPTSNRKHFQSFRSLLRSEKGTIKDDDDEYGMGNLAPVRLRDDLVDPKTPQKDTKGFTSWAVHVGKTSEEELRAGTITMHTQVHQESEKR